MSETLEKLKTVFAEDFGVGLKAKVVVTMDTLLGQGGLDLDSLDQVELLLKIEDLFGIKIPDEAADFITVGDAVKYIEAQSV